MTSSFCGVFRKVALHEIYPKRDREGEWVNDYKGADTFKRTNEHYKKYKWPSAAMTCYDLLWLRVMNIRWKDIEKERKRKREKRKNWWTLKKCAIWIHISGRLHFLNTFGIKGVVHYFCYINVHLNFKSTVFIDWISKLKRFLTLRVDNSFLQLQQN